MKHVWKTVAFGAILTIGATAVPSMTAPPFAAAQDRDRDNDHDRAQHPEYANNSYYQTGNREGYEDYQRHKQRKSHHHKYRNDDDRRAHDYGYQQGWQGQRADHSDHDDHDRPH